MPPHMMGLPPHMMPPHPGMLGPIPPAWENGPGGPPHGLPPHGPPHGGPGGPGGPGPLDHGPPSFYPPPSEMMPFDENSPHHPAFMPNGPHGPGPLSSSHDSSSPQPQNPSNNSGLTPMGNHEDQQNQPMIHPHMTHLPHLSAPFFPGPGGDMPLPPISMVSSLPHSSLPLPLPMMSHPPMGMAPLPTSQPDSIPQSMQNGGPGLLKPITTSSTAITTSSHLPVPTPMPTATSTGPVKPNTSLNNSPESGSRCSISPRDSVTTRMKLSKQNSRTLFDFYDQELCI